MNMLWRSVVGKLWMTIIGLVTVVLVILSILLVQFFDSYYYDQHYDTLENLAHKVASIFEVYDDKDQAVQTAHELVEVSKTSLVVVGPYVEAVWQVSANDDLPLIPMDQIYDDPDLQYAFLGETVVKRGHFPGITEGKNKTDIDVIIVGVPLLIEGQLAGAVYLYQTLDVIQQTINAAQKLILYAAAIAIFLTTIFAFFLSTRITSPLRQMKLAADNMAVGDFHSRVPIRSHDEIGDLALTFNHMAEHLNESIHALSHEKEQLSSILRSMVDGVITLDVQGRIILINPPAESMLNTMKYEEDLVDTPEAIPRLILDVFERVVETESEQYTSISAQGRFWDVAMAPLYNRAAIRGVVAIIRDMTEEKRLDKLRKDFVANVSHELRTPLSMMQGYSEALIDDIVESPQERKELAQIIYDESLRMGRLVHELLDLARMEARHLELNVCDMHIEYIVEKTIRKFTNLVKEQHIQLVEEITPTSSPICIDPDRMEQIFTNLIDNAIRHTPEQGKVTISLKENNHFIHIAVKDTGSGIPAEDLAFVFERFYKADKARTRGRSGTGIGLSIVKHLVEAHGGTIQVHSKPGEGTTFSIQFPKTFKEGSA